MPGGDGTGPLGQGSMTGRGAGYCSGSGVPGYASSARGGGGRGGWGGGFGRGFRNSFWRRGFAEFVSAGTVLPRNRRFSQMTEREELENLEHEADHHEQVLEEIRRRMEELRSEPDGE